LPGLGTKKDPLKGSRFRISVQVITEFKTQG
jgi:hypothetical protein